MSTARGYVLCGCPYYPFSSCVGTFKKWLFQEPWSAFAIYYQSNIWQIFQARFGSSYLKYLLALLYMLEWTSSLSWYNVLSSSSSLYCAYILPQQYNLIQFPSIFCHWYLLHQSLVIHDHRYDKNYVTSTLDSLAIFKIIQNLHQILASSLDVTRYIT